MQTDSNRLPVDRKLLARFFSKIKIDPNVSYKGVPCWLWIGCINKATNYAEFHFDGQTCLAHRIAYSHFASSDIPTDAHSDHLCRVRHCVNPSHIEIVPPRINFIRGNGFSGKNARKTRCPRGHKYTPDNIVRSTKQPTWRSCLICKRQQQRAKYITRVKKIITHCHRGHLLTPENTYTRPATGQRRCRICRDSYRKAHHLLHKGGTPDRSRPAEQITK